MQQVTPGETHTCSGVRCIRNGRLPHPKTETFKTVTTPGLKNQSKTPAKPKGLHRTALKTRVKVDFLWAGVNAGTAELHGRKVT